MKISNKKTIILIISSIIFTILMLLGVTYAFFRAKVNKGEEQEIRIQTGSAGELLFSTSNSISIVATTSNFSSGMINRTGDATLKATLQGKNIRDTYNVFVNIALNNFIYTTPTKEAEIVLQVYAPGSDELYPVAGLTPVTTGTGINEITGYDITTKSGYIGIANNYEISTINDSSDTKTDTWRIVVTFVNLESNQADNTEKRMLVKAGITSSHQTISDQCTDERAGECIANNFMLDDSLYFHSDGLENSAKDYSIRYSGSNPRNYICFGTDEETCDNEHLYRIIGSFKDFDNSTYKLKLIKDDYATKDMLGNDNYSSSISKETLTSYKGELEEIDVYYWYGNNEEKNTWTTSSLNLNSLNNNYISYLNNIDNKWVDMISETTWKIGGTKYIDIEKNYIGYSDIYFREVTKSGILGPNYLPEDEKLEEKYKIGLMYISDYMYALSPSKWNLYGYDNENDDIRTGNTYNWMYKGVNEWTTTRNTEDTKKVMTINEEGYIDLSVVSASDVALRPSFYLNSNVKIISGTGEKNNPYRISI